MDDDDTDTLVSENSRRGVVVSQHESENEEEQLWERHSLASGNSDVEPAVEVEVKVEATHKELDGVDVPSHICEAGCGHAKRAKIFAKGIPQCRARGSG